KFTESGEINVETALTARQEDTLEVKLSVRDTGIGISEEEQRFLFKPFTQVDGSMTRKYSGTGLGLSIVKHLVELMGGAVGVQSSKGAGTEFWFSIPFKVPGDLTADDVVSDSKLPIVE